MSSLTNYKLFNVQSVTTYVTELAQSNTPKVMMNGRIRLGDFRGALLGHAHMRRSRLCSTKICGSNRNYIVFIKDDGSDGD